MKIVEQQGLTFIYPFARPDSEPVGFREQIIVYPDGTMSLVWDSKARLDLEAARQLSGALLHAVEVVKNGQKRGSDKKPYTNRNML